MRIGITYDLREEYLAQGFTEEETAEFDQRSTIDAITTAITTLGHEVDCIGSVRKLVSRLAKDQRWDLVFNVCEGLQGFGREAQVPAILDAYDIPYTFADPLSACVTLHKGWTKHIARAAGVATAEFAVVSACHELQHVDLPFPLLAKPVAEGTGKGVGPGSVVRNAEQLQRLTLELLARYKQPVLIETFLPGREFTVGILGTNGDARVLGTLEIQLKDQAEPEVYSYVNKEQCETLVHYQPVSAATDPVVQLAETRALDAWRALDCRDGGRVDLRCDSAGDPQFLEINPLAGLHPTHSDLPMIATAVGMPYHTLIGEIIASAAKRRR